MADTHPEIGAGLFDRRLLARGDALAPAAQRVVRFIDQNRATALASSAMDIALSTGTSDATVVRAVQSLGFTGLGDLKQALIEAIEQPSTQVDDMRRTLADIGDSAGHAIDLVLEAHDDALATLRSSAFRDRLTASIGALHPAKRIVLFGIGPSAVMATYASILLGRSGRRTLALDRTGITLADQLLDLRRGDVVLAFAYGGPYREVTAVFNEARRLALPLVLVTDSLENKLARFADVVLPTPRGRADRVALHGATLVTLEALILSLTALQGPTAVAALDRLNGLRKAVTGR